MKTRLITGLALAALIAAPSIASAQMASPKPMMKSSPKAMSKSNSSMMKKSSMKKSSMKGSALNPSSNTHAMKAGQAQSTDPGAPTYSGSSGTGK